MESLSEPRRRRAPEGRTNAEEGLSESPPKPKGGKGQEEELTMMESLSKPRPRRTPGGRTNREEGLPQGTQIPTLRVTRPAAKPACLSDATDPPRPNRPATHPQTRRKS